MTGLRRAAIVSPVRTPVGAFGGALRGVPAEDLAAAVIRAVVDRSGIDPERIEDVSLAQSYTNSEAPCIGRWAALHAGLPIAVPQRRGEPVLVTRDEGVRPGTTPETLARLRTIVPDGTVTVTAGNAAQQNDAAAACLIVAEDRLAALGLKPIGYLDGWAAAGCDPAEMGIGPVPAVAKLLARTGRTLDEMDLVEINEAFAVQVLAVLAEWGWHDPDRLNVHGSGISLGHPIGATGVRIMTTVLHELRRRGGWHALETMCVGGGQGMAALFTAA